MSWRAYPAYNQSGIEWLGEIPEHWAIKPLKRTFGVLNGATPKSGELDYWDGDIPWATPDDLGSLNGVTIHATQRMITQKGYESCGTSLAPEGSLVLSTRAPIGHLAIAGVPLCTNQGCRCLVFQGKADRRFYYYQLLAAKEELESWGQGSTFMELSRDKLAVICLVSPPLHEQHSIAAFLDRETAQIDMLIEKKLRQNELLREKRAALISRAVTKGLDPNAKMKHCSFEWLREVPEYWESKRIKNIGHIKYGLGEPPRPLDTGLPFIRATDISDGKINLATVQRIDPDDVPWSRDPSLQTCDILVVRSGNTGDSAIVQPEVAGAIAGYDMVLRVTKASPYFVAYTLSSKYMQGQIYREKMRAALSHLNAEELGNCIILTPPESEQEVIVSYLNKKTAHLDQLLAKVDRSVVTLREYRTALISSAVTGKIDVRQEA